MDRMVSSFPKKNSQLRGMRDWCGEEEEIAAGPVGRRIGHGMNRGGKRCAAAVMPPSESLHPYDQ
jgi:hypothetical protein